MLRKILNKHINKHLCLIFLFLFACAPAYGADQRIQYNEKMVGANHPTLADTLNRALMVEHNTDGTHKSTNIYTDLITKGPWVDVRAFGAKGDGVTDDTAAFQNALNSISTKGGTIYAPAPSVRYLLTGALTVPEAPIAIIGDGKYATNIRYTGIGTFISPAGTGNDSIRIENLRIQLTGNNAVGIDASRYISSTFRSIAISSLGGTGQTGIKVNITNLAWTSYFNVADDVTFEALATGISFNSSVAQYGNRWRILAPTFLSGANGIVLNAVQGIDIIAPYFDQLSGVGITFGASCDRATIVAARQETAAGGTLFSINPASNRTTILGYQTHAGATGTNSLGLRTVILGTWEEGLKFSGATATDIAYWARSDNTGMAGSQIRGISQTATEAKNLRGNVVISGAATSGTVTFSAAEPDASYFIALSSTISSGAPAAGSLRASTASKTASGFTVNLEAAPGTGAAVSVEWILIR